MLDKWFVFEDYVCNKYYSVSYEIEGSYMPRTVKGVLISLVHGKVTLLCEHGMFVIPLKDVKYMQPATPKIELFGKKHQEVLKKLLDITK